jgi:Flp pilus assembly protein TadG
MLSLRSLRSERSQAMPEFALVAPILFLIIFGIFDFGRGIYDYVTIQTATNEAARVALEGSPDLGGSAYTRLALNAIVNTAQANTAGINIVTAGDCPNGPIPSLTALEDSTSTHYVPPNTGWLYVTPSEPMPWTTTSPCASTPPGGNQRIQVTVIYHFSPITPLIGNVIGQHVFLPIYSVYRTEY